MALSLGDPLVQSALLPLGVSLILVGIIRALGGPRRGTRFACAAIGIAFLVSVLIILGVPPFPPRASTHKLAYIVAFSLTLGVALDLFRPSIRLQRLSILVWPLIVLSWLVSARWSSLTTELVVKLVLLYAVMQLVLWRLHTRPVDEIHAPVMVFCATLGLGGVVLLAASASLSQLGFALAAATGGFLLCNWPWFRFPFGFSGLWGAALPLLVLACQSLLFAQTSPAALVLLLPLFFADWLSARLPVPKPALAQMLKPLYLTTFCLIPVVLAVTVAYQISGPLTL